MKVDSKKLLELGFDSLRRVIQVMKYMDEDVDAYMEVKKKNKKAFIDLQENEDIKVLSQKAWLPKFLMLLWTPLKRELALTTINAPVIPTEKEHKKPAFTILVTGKMEPEVPLTEPECWMPLAKAVQVPENPSGTANVSELSDSAPENAGSQGLFMPHISDGNDFVFYCHPNVVPSFSVPLCYGQTAMPPMFSTSVSAAYLPLHGHAQLYHPGYFNMVEPEVLHRGTESPVQSQIQPSLCCGMSGSGSTEHHLQADADAHVKRSAYRQHDQQEASDYSYPTWYHQGAICLNDNLIVPQEIGQMILYRPPPPVFCPDTGLMSGGPVPLCYLPSAAPYFSMVPPTYLMPHPSNSMLAPEDLALRSEIVKQIEYYFSDENLPNDHYLLSLMDYEGWVPISSIAKFNRVKKMTRDIPLILDALKSSNTIEIQGDKIRKSCDFSRLPPYDLETTALKSDIPKEQVSIDAAPSADKNQQKEDKRKGLIDEEFELNRSAVTRHWFRSSQRTNDEDDEVAVRGQDVQRLVSITQNLKISKNDGTGGKESRVVSNIVASAINDDFCFYEQEGSLRKTDKIRQVWEVRKKGDSTPCSPGLGLTKPEVTRNIAGSNGPGEHCHANKQRTENRVFEKQQFTHKQFFPCNDFQNHGNSHNYEGIMSGCPASSSVGFSSGSTPVKRHGPTSYKLDTSSKGILSKTSSPLHTMPKVSSTYKSSASRTKWVWQQRLGT